MKKLRDCHPVYDYRPTAVCRSVTLGRDQLPSSLRQPHSSPSVSDLPVHAPATSSYSLNLPLAPSITPSLFHSRLKTYLFTNLSHPSRLPSGLRTNSTALWLVRFFWASRFLFLVSSLVFLFGSVRQIKLARPICQLLGVRTSQIVEVEVEGIETDNMPLINQSINYLFELVAMNNYDDIQISI